MHARSTSSPAPTSAPPSRRSRRCRRRILRIAPPGMHAAERHPVQRLERPGRAAHRVERDAARAADLRLRAQLHPRAAVHHPGPVDAGAVRRQAAPDQRRHRSARRWRPRGCRPPTWSTRCTASNVILPAGTARIGSREYNVLMNSSPVRGRASSTTSRSRSSTARPVLLGDVAHVSDAFADQTNIVRVNGRRATYLAILKHADASTLAVVDAVARRAAARSRPPRPRGSSSRSTSTSRCSCAAPSTSVRARGDHLVAAGVADGRPLPRQLAQHGHRLHLDPAGHLLGHRRAASSPATPSTS